MKFKATIGLLAYRDEPREVTVEHELAIAIDEAGRHGIYDRAAGAYAVLPGFDNIFELGTSVFAFSQCGHLALWTILAIRNPQDEGMPNGHQIRQMTEFHLDRIEMRQGIAVLQGYGHEGIFYRIYKMDADWLSEEWEWAGVMTSGLILTRTSTEERLITPSGRILWREEGPSMLVSTDCILGDDARYPILFDFSQERHLFPVFRPSEDDDESGRPEIWKYIKSRNPPKWCATEQFFCPMHTGCMDVPGQPDGGGQ